MFEFWTKNARVKVPVEGKFTFITYRFTGARGTEPSGLAVVRNYENAIRKVGGTILESVPTWWVNAKIVKDGNEVWVQVEKGNGQIWLRIVEKKEMEQSIVADAAAFGNDIKTTGHVAVYGINFDTGKATITPESAQAIGEVAKLLTTDPGLKVHVVGHTDNVGSVESNLKLSQDRAAGRAPGARAAARDRRRAPAGLRLCRFRAGRVQRRGRWPGEEPPGRDRQAVTRTTDKRGRLLNCPERPRGKG